MIIHPWKQLKIFPSAMVLATVLCLCTHPSTTSKVSTASLIHIFNLFLSIEETTKKSKKKKMKTAEVDEEAEPIKEDNPNAVSNFRISEPLRNALKAKGIEA
ncbi:unnamed protein product [Lactuca virosa]|uniref:Uncharacterized protein n=1 Tax=Lactuca virosa TaxID=75947 RepID=A0AAU9NUN2_9ASTR|nr:unnamed protein product [Lactuca virosa]